MLINLRDSLLSRLRKMSIIHEKFSFSQIQPIQEHSNEESFQFKAKK